MKVDNYIRAPQADTTEVSWAFTTFTTTGVFTSGLTTTVDGRLTVIPVTMSGTRTVTTEAPITTSTNTSSHNQTSRAIVGGVLGAASFIILALVIFFVLRHKRRHKASRSTSAGDGSTSSNVPGQCTSRSARLPTTPRPFLDFPMTQNYSTTKGVTTDRAGIIPAQSSAREIEPENPFRDPVVTESNNEGEGLRVRNALDNLQALTSRFEEELQQLCALAQSGQLSAEDSLKLEEIRRTTGLTIQFDSRRDRFSVVRSASVGSSFSLEPPSYHTRGG